MAVRGAKVQKSLVTFYVTPLASQITHCVCTGRTDRLVDLFPWAGFPSPRSSPTTVVLKPSSGCREGRGSPERVVSSLGLFTVLCNGTLPEQEQTLTRATGVYAGS